MNYIFIVSILFLPVRIPSLPVGNLAEDDGYNFTSDKHTRASYFTMLESCGFIGEEGADLSKERWLDSSFFLPFKLGARYSDNQYNDEIGDKILQRPTVANAGKTSLFLRFETTTTYVIR